MIGLQPALGGAVPVKRISLADGSVRAWRWPVRALADAGWRL